MRRHPNLCEVARIDEPQAGAVTSAALVVAPELPATLIASDDGHPVYRRLGFWDLFRATMWEHPPR